MTPAAYERMQTVLHRWEWTTTVVQVGTCLLHGSHAGLSCPTCHTAAIVYLHGTDAR